MQKRIKILTWIPAILWYSVIFRFSAQPATVSGGLSDRFLWRILEVLSPAFAAASWDAQTASVEMLSFFERKIAHMFLYFVLALLVLFALGFLCRRRRFQIGLTLLACTVLASLDEYHQTMVPGRSGEVRDVLVDLTGGAIALGLTALPLLADWSRRSMGFPLPAIIPALLCLLPLFPVLLSLETLAGVPTVSQAAEQFVPAGAISKPWSALLAELAPILRETLFLAACGLLGACVFFAIGLAGLSWRSAVVSSLGSLLLVSGLSGAAKISVPLAAAGMTGLGLILAALLWAAGRRMTDPLQYQRHKPAGRTSGAGIL